MFFNRRKLALSSTLLLGLPLACGSVFAAQVVDLSNQPLSFLQSSQSLTPGVTIKEIKRNVDFKKTLHVRIQEMYNDYPVFGADAVVHIPKANKNLSLNSIKNGQGFMNGIFYQNIQKDLANTPKIIFTEAQAQKMEQLAVATFQQKTGNGFTISNQQSKLIVYIDKSNKAHWAYQISFSAQPPRTNITPAEPVFVIDAVTSQIYTQWDDIETMQTPTVTGGGFGGNKKMGKLVYDGLKKHLASLEVQRDATTNTCSMQNPDVLITDYTSAETMSFSCKAVDPKHNNVYWDGQFDKVNGGYSPANDAMSAGIVIKHMYKDWYGVPVLTEENGDPMVLHMIVHRLKYDNAYWSNQTKAMTFGDGAEMFYPLTSLGVGAHEISHGFTYQHSNLYYKEQSGGMNESFSDMAAQAAEVYSYGKNSWQIGPEIFKEEGQALRYMDQPSKDCEGRTPGQWCSIDDATQYVDGLDVHFSSGVYNRFFYTLSTTEGWDVKKAFNVMVQANANYWTAHVTFASGACGVISAAKDLDYNVDDVKKAFDVVKVSYADCKQA